MTPPNDKLPAAPIKPSFDVVRVDADGNALVAGRAAPRANIRVLLDGAEVSQAATDAGGSFAAIFSVPPADAPRVVSLVMEIAGKVPVSSDATVILAPSTVVAAVAPEPVAESPQATTPEANEVAALQTPVDVAEAPAGAELQGSAADGLIEPSAETPAVAGAPAEKPEIITAIRPEPETGLPAGQSGAPAPRADSLVVTDAPVEAEAGDSASVDLQLAEVADTPQAPAPETAAATGETEAAAVAPEPPLQSTEIEPVAEPAPKISPAEVAVAELTPEVSVAETAPSASAPLAADPAPATPEAGAAETETPAPEPAAPAVLLADDSGIRVLQSGGPGPQGVQSVVIDTITYDPEGEVSLGGRGAGAGFVRVYLDNKPIRTTEIGIDGQWRAELPAVDTGVYTLRVDEVNAAGSVVSRVETPFKREEPEVLAALDSRDDAARAAEVGVVTVQPGNTLWGIATDEWGDGFLYVRVFNANKDRIRDPDLIYPGQVFSIPN